jgi:hypothetical protein
MRIATTAPGVHPASNNDRATAPEVPKATADIRARRRPDPPRWPAGVIVIDPVGAVDSAVSTACVMVGDLPQSLVRSKQLLDW